MLKTFSIGKKPESAEKIKAVAIDMSLAHISTVINNIEKQFDILMQVRMTAFQGRC
ncbi:hypothetical protein QUF90_03945 [Desulfococcaceae bacterium HSG9]|nr:hypothetical protein [Desulfococcaceae bacterium HSG9]